MFPPPSPASVFFLPIQLGSYLPSQCIHPGLKGRFSISDELGPLMFAQQMFTFKVQHSLPQIHISSFISPSSPPQNLPSQSIFSLHNIKQAFLFLIFCQDPFSSSFSSACPSKHISDCVIHSFIHSFRKQRPKAYHTRGTHKGILRKQGQVSQGQFLSSCTLFL